MLWPSHHSDSTYLRNIHARNERKTPLWSRAFSRYLTRPSSMLSERRMSCFLRRTRCIASVLDCPGANFLQPWVFWSFHQPPHWPSPPHRSENRSPFLLLNGVELSYLLFSSTRSFSVVGACLVGAGSYCSLLGDPTGSIFGSPPFRAEVPMVEEEPGCAGTLSEYSSDSTMFFFLRCSSRRAWRSALMLRLATT